MAVVKSSNKRFKHPLQAPLMKLTQIYKMNLKRAPISVVKNESQAFLLTKGRFILSSIDNKAFSECLDTENDLIDGCCFDKRIFVVTKKGQLLKIVADKVEPVELNFRVTAINTLSNGKEMALGTREGKIVILDKQLKSIKKLYLLTDTITGLDLFAKNKIIVSCTNSSSLFVLDSKKVDKKAIDLTKGEVSAFSVYNKNNVLAGTEEGWLFNVSLTTNEIVDSIRLNHPVSCIKCTPTLVVVGTKTGQLFFVEVANGKFVIKHTEEVGGIVNGIEIDGSKLVVLCRREEARGVFYKNKAFKNSLITYKMH